MPSEIVIETEDKPGVLAGIGELFGERGVNITAAAAFTQSGRGVFHFVVDDADGAKAALSDGGYTIVSIEEVLAISLDDRPGELGRFARKLAASGVNIKSFYTGRAFAGETEIILSVDNLDAARKGL